MKCFCPASLTGFFKAACDAHRQQILFLIKKHHSINAGQIVQSVKLSQPTVSHHLKILKEAGLITADKKGKEVFYSINKQNIANCCSDFSKNFS